MENTQPQDENQVEEKKPEPAEERDFLAGVKACDRFDPTCESCQ